MFNIPFGFGGFEDGLGSANDANGGMVGAVNQREMTIDDWIKMIRNGYKQPGRNGFGTSGIAPAMAFMGLPNMAGGPHRNGQYGGAQGILQAFLANGGFGPVDGVGNGGGGGGGNKPDDPGGGGGGNKPPPFAEPDFLVAPPIGTGAQWRNTMR